jgi:hypothetical protein
LKKIQQSSVNLKYGFPLYAPVTKENPMPKRKGKTPSFDWMVKFFMRQYNIPTKKDVDKLMAKLDRLENLIKQSALSPDNADIRIGRRKTALTAIDVVLDAIKRSKQGADFATIQTKTGFDEKKIRNIIFRLNKIGKIKRKSRGIYTAV